MRHGARLADHHTRLKRVEDMEEVQELGTEHFTKLGHVLAALQIGLSGDDGNHSQVARIVGIRESLDRLVQLLVWLRVCRDQSDVP